MRASVAYSPAIALFVAFAVFLVLAAGSTSDTFCTVRELPWATGSSASCGGFTTTIPYWYASLLTLAGGVVYLALIHFPDGGPSMGPYFRFGRRRGGYRWPPAR